MWWLQATTGAMMTIGAMLDAINRKRLVRMDYGERVGDILPGMCGEWGVLKTGGRHRFDQGTGTITRDPTDIKGGAPPRAR